MTFSGKGRDEIPNGFAGIVGNCEIVVLGSGFTCSGWSGGHSDKNLQFWQRLLSSFAVAVFALSLSSRYLPESSRFVCCDVVVGNRSCNLRGFAVQLNVKP